MRLTIKHCQSLLDEIPYSNFRLQKGYESGYIVRSSAGSVCFVGSNLSKIEVWAKLTKDWKILRDESENETFRYMSDRHYYRTPKFDEVVRYLYLYDVEGEFLNSLKAQVMGFFTDPDKNIYNTPLSEKQIEAAMRVINL